MEIIRPNVIKKTLQTWEGLEVTACKTHTAVGVQLSVTSLGYKLTLLCPTFGLKIWRSELLSVP